MSHVSVLLQETIDSLDIQPGDTVLDETLGAGGHSEEILKRHGSAVRLICLDQDEDAIARSRPRLEKYGAQIDLIQGNFRNLDTILDSIGVGEVNKILLDLGLSSNQIDESGRGFSFQRDEPLQMTFKKSPDSEKGETTAYTIVNEWSEETLATILYAYGDERYSKRIAQGIVEAREAKPIKTTFELAEVVKAATPRWYHFGKIHPATRTFQALRIAVNDEYRALEEGLQKGFARLAKNGRMAVISFHSLEDRLVKDFFKQKQKEGAADLYTKKPITPADEEIAQNRRSRSAKLRTIIKK